MKLKQVILFLAIIFEAAALIVKVDLESFNFNTRFIDAGPNGRIHTYQKITTSEKATQLKVFFDRFKLDKNATFMIKLGTAEYENVTEKNLQQYNNKFFDVNVMEFKLEQEPNHIGSDIVISSYSFVTEETVFDGGFFPFPKTTASSFKVIFEEPVDLSRNCKLENGRDVCRDTFFESEKPGKLELIFSSKYLASYSFFSIEEMTNYSRAWSWSYFEKYVPEVKGKIGYSLEQPEKSATSLKLKGYRFTPLEVPAVQQTIFISKAVSLPPLQLSEPVIVPDSPIFESESPNYSVWVKETLAKRRHPTFEITKDFPTKIKRWREKVAEIQKTGPEREFIVSVNRQTAATEFLKMVSESSSEILKKPLLVKFLNGPLMDPVESKKELFKIITPYIFDMSKRFFIISKENDYAIWVDNKLSDTKSLETYKTFGRIVGIALLNDVSFVGVKFSIALLRLFMGLFPSLEIFEDLDINIYKTLKALRNGEDVEKSQFETILKEPFYGGNYQRYLRGKPVEVTADDKECFVQAFSEYYFFQKVFSQTEKIREGFFNVVPNWEFRPLEFTAKEFEQLVCAADVDIDIDEFEKYASIRVFESTKGTYSYRWFLRMLRSFDMQKRKKLLKFITGSTRLPPTGFRGLEPQLRVIFFVPSYGSSLLPTAITK